MEGLYSGLGSGAGLSATQLDAKIKLLVEAPAAVEDALASLLDHHDATLQVGLILYLFIYLFTLFCWPLPKLVAKSANTAWALICSTTRVLPCICLGW